VLLVNLGLDETAEAVYRGLLAHPDYDPPHLAARLELAPDAVAAALERLRSLSLTRAPAEAGRVRAVSPVLAMEILLARRQAELAEQQRRVDAGRAEAMAWMTRYGHGYDAPQDETMLCLRGLDAVRDYLEAVTVESELLTFSPGGPQTPESMRASRPKNQALLGRGVQMRTLYLDSITRHAPTLEHARWLASLGALIRTVPELPTRMLLVDRRSALVALDPAHTAAGALVVTSPGLVDTLYALFETAWAGGRPLDAGDQPAPVPGLLPRDEAEVLRLLARGLTDVAIAHRLGVSERTARRLAGALLERLGAVSRFQAGARAVQLGHLPPHPE
jgi:DNA-binding CsgD family transcriptional regulator